MRCRSARRCRGCWLTRVRGSESGRSRSGWCGGGRGWGWCCIGTRGWGCYSCKQRSNSIYKHYTVFHVYAQVKVVANPSDRSYNIYSFVQYTTSKTGLRISTSGSPSLSIPSSLHTSLPCGTEPNSRESFYDNCLKSANHWPDLVTSVFM